MRVLILLALLTACSSPPTPGDEGAADVGSLLDTSPIVDVTGSDLTSDIVHLPDVAPSDVAEAPPLPLPATEACAAPTPNCGPAVVDGKVYASYRKDYFLPNSLYDTELEDEPLDGGRFHVAAIAQASGPVTEARINGTPVPELLAALKMDWHHVWPPEATPGEPLWFAFHSRDAAWNTSDSGTITLLSDDVVLVEGDFPVTINPLVFTFVTLSADRETLLVHVRNDDSMAHTLARLDFDGNDVLAGQGACIADLTLEPGEQALWTIPLCEAPTPGAAWTLVAHWVNGEPTVAVGRHLRPFFPIEAWQKGSDCPLPGSNDAAYDLFTQGGIDTFYLYWGSGGKCDYDNATLYNETLPGTGVYALLGDDFPWDDPPIDVLLTTEAIAGVLTGDESDWHYVTDEGAPKPESKATKSRKVWAAFPELTTYNGAMTSKHIGAFAGMTDVQGIDVYAAGCAPHMFKWGEGAPPLRAPFDFLRNARNNHMPWPTWLYSQGMAGWAAMPDPHELLIQGLEVVAAGGKGLMWFQVGEQMAADYPDSWQAITDVNWMVRAVRPWLREGDVTGLATSDPDTIVEAIRARDALIVPVITTAAVQGPTDEECIYFELGMEDESEVHWELLPTEVSVAVTIPDDLAVNELFEITSQGTVDYAFSVSRDQRTLHLSAVPLDTQNPVRLFVLAATGTVRSAIDQRASSVRSDDYR